jgi:DNA-binding transcriptional ArsR family regulator
MERRFIEAAALAGDIGAVVIYYILIYCIGMKRARMRGAPGDDLQVFKAAFFKALAHPVRIRVLEALVRGERSVQELQETLGLEQPVVSQHLAVLRANNIVVGRKEGVSVRYAVRDPLVADLLAVARRIFDNQLVGTQELLRRLRDEHRRRASSRM